MSNINIAKDVNNKDKILFDEDIFSDMENAIKKIFNKLEKPYSEVDPENIFNDLLNYITNYDRVLYSTVSNIIYANYEYKENYELSGNLMHNLDKLVHYSTNSENIANKKKNLSGSQTEDDVDNCKKIVLKLWDHVMLANRQYVMLKQSDSEYDEKFEKRILKYQSELEKQMNSQLITMIGIFTALAFLIFGSISSLDGVFENIKLPIFKAMSLGLIWGLCISNMIFVFLYCVGKMTDMSFKANKNKNATIYQKYPVVFWTNFILIFLLAISLWGHFVQYNKIGIWLCDIIMVYPEATFIIGGLTITVLGILAFMHLNKKTKYIDNDV